MSSAHIKSVQTEKETWHPSDTQIVYFYSIFSCFLSTQNKENKKRKSPKTLEALGLFPLVGEDGFEPSKRNAADLQSVPFGHSGTPPYEIGCSGACLEPVDGLEPPTYWLQISCSTDWAIPAAQTEHAYYSTGGRFVKHFFDGFRHLVDYFENRNLVPGKSCHIAETGLWWNARIGFLRCPANWNLPAGRAAKSCARYE